MELNEAYKKMAKLMKDESDYYDKNIKPYLKHNIDDKVFKEKDNLANEVKYFGKELAGDPYIYPILEHFMIDIKGCCGEAGEKEQEKVSKTLDFKEFIDSQGSIPSMIQNFIEYNGFKITDRGGGAGGCWHIGVPCNDSDANRLCILLHINFKNLIDKKYIRIVRNFWGYKLPGLKNWNQLEEWLEKNNLG